MDQAGWLATAKLKIPGTISIIALPATCHGLNPVENIGQFMRDNGLSTQVLTACDTIAHHCCKAANTLINQPWRIMSIGMRQWAHGS
jgi:hypothetical protein